MGVDSTFGDLVQYNDGFRTQLIGKPDRIAERVAAYRKRGVDLILGARNQDSEEDSVGRPVLASSSAPVR
jgi:dimethylsulfone monooxygenase